MLFTASSTLAGLAVVSLTRGGIFNWWESHSVQRVCSAHCPSDPPSNIFSIPRILCSHQNDSVHLNDGCYAFHVMTEILRNIGSKSHAFSGSTSENGIRERVQPEARPMANDISSERFQEDFELQ